MHDDLKSWLPKAGLSRREFVVTTLATGFALAVQPVSAETITTDTTGLEAGEVKIPTADGTDARLSRDACRQWPISDGPGRAGNLRRSRTHQGHLPPTGQARLLRRRPRALCPARRRLEDDRHRRDHRQGRVEGARRTGDERSRRHCRLGQEDRQGRHREARRSPASAGAGASCGSTRRTIRTSKPASPGMAGWSGAADPLHPEASGRYRRLDSRPRCSACTAKPTPAFRSNRSRRCARRPKPPASRPRSSSIPTRRTASTPTIARRIARNAADDGWKRMLAWFKKHGAG